jgi:hypothetical protein
MKTVQEHLEAAERLLTLANEVRTEAQRSMSAAARVHIELARELRKTQAAPRVISDSEAAKLQVTMETIRSHADDVLANAEHVKLNPGSHAAGYASAIRDIRTILDAHGRPAGEPVIFEAAPVPPWER